MASTFFRKIKTLDSKFPCKAHLNRLSKVSSVMDIGVFTIDKCRIVIEDDWRVEDCLGSCNKKSEPQFKANGSPNGYIHYINYLKHEYQIYQGFGKNRTILVNPRHFDCFDDFQCFLQKIIGGRPYHISGIDLSWMLYKKYFSIDFLFWITWVKNSKIYKPIPIKAQLDRDLNKCLFKEFRIGKKAVVKAYDCDIHNTDKQRDQKWRMNDCVNLEISLCRDAVGQLGICKLKDLKRFNFIDKALEKMIFVAPSKIAFRGTRFKTLHEHWEAHGATSMAREYNRLSGSNNYHCLHSKLKPIYIGKDEMSVALLKLAKMDWDSFKKGRVGRHRYPLRNLAYDLPVLFDTSTQQGQK